MLPGENRAGEIDVLPIELDRSIDTLGDGSIVPPGEGHAAVLLELECVSGGGRML